MYFQHFYDIKTDFFVMKSMSSDRLCVCVCVNMSLQVSKSR